MTRFARRMIGVPYVTAGAKPSGVDCSGLTMLAYRKVGTKLGHYTGDQWNSGPHRYKVSQLRPATSSSSSPTTTTSASTSAHGRLIHAPKPGDVVKVASMSNSWFAGNFSGSVRPAADPPARPQPAREDPRHGSDGLVTGASSMLSDSSHSRRAAWGSIAYSRTPSAAS